MRDRLSLMTFPMDIDVAMRKLTVREILEMTRAAGISYVDVMNLSGDRLREYTAAMQETGIQPNCYIGTVSFFSGSEESIRQALQEQLETATRLGAARYMIVPINPQKDQKICERMGREQVQERLQQFYRMAVNMGQECGMPVCYETTPQDYACLSGIDDCRWILEQVPGLGLVYDTANMLPHGDEPLAYYEALRPYIVYVHAKDVALAAPTLRDRIFHAERIPDGRVMKCCVSGTGVIPLEDILTRMEHDGYTGLYALEYSHPDRYPANREQSERRLQEHMTFWNAWEMG